MNGYHVLRIMGEPGINGIKTNNIKALQLAYILSTAKVNNLHVKKNEVMKKLYKGHSSKNAIWYAVKGCKDCNLDIKYNRSNHSYFIDYPIFCDLNIVFQSLSKGNLENALFFSGGPILNNDDDYYTKELCVQLKNAIDNALNTYPDKLRKLFSERFIEEGLI